MPQCSTGAMVQLVGIRYVRHISHHVHACQVWAVYQSRKWRYRQIKTFKCDKKLSEKLWLPTSCLIHVLTLFHRQDTFHIATNEHTNKFLREWKNLILNMNNVWKKFKKKNFYFSRELFWIQVLYRLSQLFRWNWYNYSE